MHLHPLEALIGSVANLAAAAVVSLRAMALFKRAVRAGQRLPTDIDALAQIDLHLFGRLLESTPAPSKLRAIPGEISGREGRMLYALAARVWDGAANVLELGTLFGASTQWLGLGMAARPSRHGRLIAADAFAPYYAPADMEARLRPLLGAHRDWSVISADFAETGFRRAFEALHAEGKSYSHFLTIERCYVPSSPGESHAEIEQLADTAAPIGLLVVDSVKSWYPIRAMMLELSGQLAPGAIVAWQDHRWFNSFGISFLNERISDTMELLAIADSMHVYRYRSGLSSDMIARAMPETVGEIPVDDLRSMFCQMAWRNYIRNDAQGVLSATLQLAFALATHGQHGDEAWALFESARRIPGFGDHDELFQLAQGELETLL